MKDSYFPHYFNSRNDDKILKLRTHFNNAEGFGLFWMIAEVMAEKSDGYIKEDDMAELSLSLSLPNGTIKNLLDYCLDIGLLFKDENGITSKTTQEFKTFRKERSDAGKKGASHRWHKNMSNGSANGSAIKQLMAIKETKQNKRKENKIVCDSDFIDSLKTTYSWVDIDTEFKKIDAWISVNPQRKKTRKFIINWLNRIEKPINTSSIGRLA